jgi:hypothetical protein
MTREDSCVCLSHAKRLVIREDSMLPPHYVALGHDVAFNTVFARFQLERSAACVPSIALFSCIVDGWSIDSMRVAME